MGRNPGPPSGRGRSISRRSRRSPPRPAPNHDGAGVERAAPRGTGLPGTAGTMRSFLFSAVIAISATAAGCLDQGKADEEEPDILDESKADSQLKPTYHGDILFATPAHAAIQGNERYHAWTFGLSGDAK